MIEPEKIAEDVSMVAYYMSESEVQHKRRFFYICCTFFKPNFSEMHHRIHFSIL